MKNFEKYRNTILVISMVVLVILVGSLLFINLTGGDSGSLSKGGNLQKTDLANLNYPNQGRGFLACNEQVCPGSKADSELIEFSFPVKSVRNAFIAIADTDPKVRMRELDIMNRQYDMTVKTRGKTFPDLLTVKFILVENNPSKTYVAIYSRAIIGDPTPAKDIARVKKILERVTASLAN